MLARLWEELPDVVWGIWHYWTYPYLFPREIDRQWTECADMQGFMRTLMEAHTGPGYEDTFAILRDRVFELEKQRAELSARVPATGLRRWWIAHVCRVAE